MNKPIIVITHERSGTHLLINLINYDKFGEFYTIGYIDKKLNIEYNLENYKFYTYKDIIVNSYRKDAVCKSHHQVEFMIDYLDFLFSNYKVIYLKRDVKDVLISYYKFLPFPQDLDIFPKFQDWIFMKPDDIGKKFLLPYSSDPHVIIEPENYLYRWKLHVDGWLKYKDNMLVLNYEDILKDFKNQKNIIENYIGKTIADKIPDVNDKKFPNFNPGKGIIGGYKQYMDENLINKINRYFR